MLTAALFTTAKTLKRPVSVEEVVHACGGTCLARRHPTKTHRRGSVAPRHNLKREAQPPEPRPFPQETAIAAAGCRARAF